MKPPKTKLMLAALAATLLCLGARAETTNTVKVTKFHQSYPYSGKAMIEYTVGGTLPANAIAEFTISTDDRSATFTQKDIVTGANTNVIDFASSFGGVLLLTNASFVVTIDKGDLGGVQLWENGPYWAECNVGASKPEEYGYYFWWGDTVGYSRSGGTISSSSYHGVTWMSSTGEQMNISPFTSSSCLLYGKDNSALLIAGYIDSTGNLAAAHDAATAHLGSPWRMPTNAEFNALSNNCIAAWITTNGVSGQLFTGKGAYANRSIFLPAAGSGTNSELYYYNSEGKYWSSTPSSTAAGGPISACNLGFYSGGVSQSYNYGRYEGFSVRPVRGFAE